MFYNRGEVLSDQFDHAKGTPHRKKIDFFRALPKLPPHTPPPHFFLIVCLLKIFGIRDRCFKLILLRKKVIFFIREGEIDRRKE